MVILNDGVGFGAVLREFRLRAALSQEALAERSRLSVGAISALERGIRRAPYRSSIDLLADGLGITSQERQQLHAAAQRKRQPRAAPESPGENALADRRGRLPASLNSLFGREAEIANIAALLAERRLATLCGPGGVGKTRLAIEAAARHADLFTGGIRFVDLSVIERPSLVAATAAMALGVLPGLGVSTVASIVMALESSDGLVVLDNCEHVLDSVATLVTTLVSSCPHLRVLATSREPLRLDGEAVVQISALSLDAESHTDLPPALELFFSRARDAGVPLDPATHRDDAATICTRLDGLPLAIELAASRTRSLSCRQIAAMLDRRFAILIDERSGRAPRHRTLRAALDWSHELLSPGECVLFRRLAAFPGNWSLEAATSICAFEDDPDGSQTAATHSSLIERSLITVVPTDETYRYAFAETVRQYASYRLEESGERVRVYSALVSYAVALAERCARKQGGPEESLAIDEIDVEYATVRAALEYACTSGDDRLAAHRLVSALRGYWTVRGVAAEAIDWCSRAIRGTATGIDGAVVARTRLTLARFLRTHQRIAESSQLDDDVLRYASESGDRALTADALMGLAGDAFLRGRFDDAFERYREAAGIFRETQSSLLLATALHSLAAIATLLHRFDEADAFLDESGRIYSALEDRRGQGWVAFRKGFRAFAVRDFTTAERHFRASLKLRTQCGDQSGIASCLQNVAVIVGARGATGEAAAMLRECLEISRTYGLTVRSIEAAERIAQLSYRAKRYDRIAGLVLAARSVRRNLECPMEPFDAADLADVLASVESAALAVPEDGAAAVSLDQLMQRASSALDDLDVMFDEGGQRVGPHAARRRASPRVEALLHPPDQ